jgi:CHAD domain-containing protein
MNALATASARTIAGQASSSRRLAGTLLKRRADALFRHFPAALGGDEEAIHQLRVAGRRLRVAVLLLADKPDGRRATRIQRLLRKLTRLAGKSRDLDVLLATYDQRLKSLPTRDAVQNRLRHRLGDARRRGRVRMVDDLLDLEIAQLRRDLGDLMVRGGPPIHLVCQRFCDLREHEGMILRDGFAKLGAVLDPQALHDLRRRARRLRYAVEIAQAIAPLSDGATKPWKALQDRIGVLHDHEVLAVWFDQQARADEHRGHGALAAVAMAEAAWARAAMQRLHDSFLTENAAYLVSQGLAACELRTTPTGS